MECKRNLYIDFDGVIMDTPPLVNCFLAEQGIDRKLAQEDIIRKALTSLCYKQTLAAAPIISEAFDRINKIIASGKYKVSILSKVITLEEGVAKVKFLREHLEDVTIILVPSCVCKTDMVDAKDAILVDDYAGNLRSWQEHGGAGVLFRKNGKSDKGFPVIGDLSELLELVI